MSIPNEFVASPDTASIQPAITRSIRLGRKADWVLMAVIAVILIFYLGLVINMSWRAVVFPLFITIAMAITLAAYAVSKWRNPAVWDEVYRPPAEEKMAEGDIGPHYLLENTKGVKQSIAGFLAITVLTLAIGPVYAVPLFVGSYLFLKGENRILAVVAPVVLWLVIHYGFSAAMHITLPSGYLSALF